MAEEKEAEPKEKESKSKESKIGKKIKNIFSEILEE